MRIIVARHLERYSLDYNSGLSENGMKQRESWCKMINEHFAISAIFHSPILRAFQTCELLEAPHIPDDRLMDASINQSNAPNRTYEDVLKDVQSFLKTLREVAPSYGDVLIVAHGSVCQAFLGLAFEQIQVPFGHYFVLDEHILD